MAIADTPFKKSINGYELLFLEPRKTPQAGGSKKEQPETKKHNSLQCK